MKPLIGQKVEIRSDGRIVSFGNAGFRAALKKRNLHRAVLRDIEEIVASSRYFDYRESDGQGKRGGVLGPFVYAVPVRIGGETYRCEVVIDRQKTSADGEGSFKQQSVFKITDVALSVGLDSGAHQGRSEAGASSTTSAMMRMGELMEGRKPKTPSGARGRKFKLDSVPAGTQNGGSGSRERAPRISFFPEFSPDSSVIIVLP